MNKLQEEIVAEKTVAVEKETLNANTQIIENIEIKDKEQEKETETVTVDEPPIQEVNKNGQIIQEKQTDLLETDVLSRNTENTQNTVPEDKVQETQINREETSNDEKLPQRKINTYLKALEVSQRYAVFRKNDTTDEEVLCKVNAKGPPTEITNILPVVLSKIERTNGEDIEKTFELKAFVLDQKDKELPVIEVSEREFSKITDTINNNWFGNVVFHEGSSDKRLKEILQIIGRTSAKQKKIYEHTGFIRQNGKLVYLYHGGNIGTDETIETDLSRYDMQQYCFTDKEFDIKEALETELETLDLADFKITIPLIATTFLAPLFEILQEEGILINYVLLVIGPTGTYKSSIVALELSHFGNFESNTMPSSFRSTFNNIERKAFIAKDTLFAVDDYKPETLESDQEKTMENIFGLWGDRYDRGRMNPNGSLQKKHPARGLGIVTGERAPKFSQSRLARAMPIYTEEGSINFEKLKSIHNKKEQLSFCMKEYIDWIILNEQLVRQTARQLQEMYSMQTKDLQVHPRIKQNIVVMMIGFTFWLEFLFSFNIIAYEKKEELQVKAYDVLKEVGISQANDVDDEDPVRIFFNVLSQLMIAGKVYFQDYKTGVAEGNGLGTLIGYKDGNQRYLIADAVYKVVQTSYNNKFLATENQLWKSLKDSGYIIPNSTDNRSKVRRKDPHTGNKVEVIVVPEYKWNEAIQGEETATCN